LDKLRQEIANLEAQEAEIEQSLNAAVTDKEAILIANDLKLIRNRLSKKQEELRQMQEKEQARAKVIEAKAQDEAIPFAVAGIDFTDLPAEVITLIEAVVKADRRRLLNEHAIELEQMEAEHARAMQEKIMEYNNLERMLDETIKSENKLQTEVGEAVLEIARLRDVSSQLALEKADAIEKRDAAVREKEENDLSLRTQLQMCEKERDELRAQLEEYEKAAEYQARQDQPLNLAPEEATSLQEKADAVKKLFAAVEDWGSIQKVIKPDGTFELATRQEVEADWAPIEPPEVTPFRGEIDEPDIVAPEVDAPVEDAFRDLTTQHGDNQDADRENVGTVQEEATLEERVARLELAVFGQVWKAA